jgi:putative peptidoglycan lipid II flippase
MTSQAATSADHSHRALSGAVRVVSGMTLLSRLGGMLREVLVARIFGDTTIGSAFAAGFAIPNMFRRLFGEGALSAAFIPEYAAASKADPESAGRVASLTIWLLFLATTALTVLIEIGLFVAVLLVPADRGRTLSFELIMLMLPFMPLVCCAAILGGVLQVHGRFAPAASGPIILNTVITSVGLYFLIAGRLGHEDVAFWLGLATVVSGLTQCLWFHRLLRPYVRWTRDVAAAKPVAAAMLRKFVPALIGMGTLQINTFMDVLLAMWPIWIGATVLGREYPMDVKSNVILNAAQRLYQFPLGVFGIAVATAVFPLLARHADEPSHFLQTLRRGLRLSLFIGLPASVGLILVRRELTDALYGGRQGFSAEALARAASVLAGFAPAVWAYSINHVFTRAFYAVGNTRTPMRVAMAMVGLNFGLNIVLIWPLREAGLAWATSLTAMVQSCLLGVLCRRVVKGPILDRDAGRGILTIVAAAIVMGAGVFALGALLPSATTWTAHLLTLAALCGAGGALYLASAAALGCHELGWLLRRS